MLAAQELSTKVGTRAACQALALTRASFYRKLKPKEDLSNTRPTPERALSSQERQRVLDYLHSERFVDQAPQEVYATLLDEGTYLCSVRTMYRILEEQQEVR